jgi:hypothetical protein
VRSHDLVLREHIVVHFLLLDVTVDLATGLFFRDIEPADGAGCR